MRGDSLRDLYAKTLALVGLGLLAGVGALVDYWPVGVGVPQVAAVGLEMPDRVAMLPAHDIDIPVLPAAPAARPAAVMALAALFAEPAPSLRLGSPIALDPVAVPAVVVTTIAADPAPTPAPTVPVVAQASVPPLVAGPDFDPELVFQMASDESDGGFLSGAMDVMRSTGSTIARGGVITGTSIVGALRIVSGAFKKLKFF